MPALLSALQPRLQGLLEALLRAARSVSPQSALAAARSAPQSVLRFMSSVSTESGHRSLRSVSLQSVAHDAKRLARHPSRLALGAVAAIAIIGAVLTSLSGGSAAPAVSDAAVHGAPAAAAGPLGHAPATGLAPAIGLAPATGHAPAGHLRPGHAPGVQLRGGHAPSGHRPAGRKAARHAHAAIISPAVVPAKPYQIYDSVIPGAIPAAQKSVATYATGPFAARASEMAGRKSVLWIDTRGFDYQASALDVEPGDATPSVAASWAWHRLKAHPHGVARIYTMIAEWPAVKAAVASFPAQMRDRIHWWIADPNGHPHLVPGSDATQWYWGSNYDITMAAPGF